VFVLVDARGARRVNLDGLELINGPEPEGDDGEEEAQPGDGSLTTSTASGAHIAAG
jgi:hypothetical protein